MNKSHLLLFLLISSVVSLVVFFTLENLFFFIGIILLYLVASLLLFMPMLKKHQQFVTRFHECYHFINNFIISLSIKKNIAGALETTVNSMPSEFVDQYNSLEKMSDNEKLNYLSTYFTFNVYQLFLQILTVWEEEGGDIIAMSKYLTGEIRNNEEYISKCESLSKRKYFEIGALWILCLAILIFLRFALKDFYNKIKSQLVFIISITALAIFILFSIYLLIKKATDVAIKGDNKNEKNI